MSPTNTNKAKTNIARATGLMAAGTCATSALRWVFRAGKHRTQSAEPRVRFPAEQIKAWTGIWNRATEETKKRVRATWAKTYAKLSKAKSRWQCVKGPIAACISTLLDVEWKPVGHNYWITPTPNGCSRSNEVSSEQCASFTGLGGRALHEILYRLEEDLDMQVWRHASTSHNGTGLDH